METQLDPAHRKLAFSQVREEDEKSKQTLPEKPQLFSNLLQAMSES